MVFQAGSPWVRNMMARLSARRRGPCLPAPRRGQLGCPGWEEKPIRLAAQLPMAASKNSGVRVEAFSKTSRRAARRSAPPRAPCACFFSSWARRNSARAFDGGRSAEEVALSQWEPPSTLEEPRPAAEPPRGLARGLAAFVTPWICCSNSRPGPVPPAGVALAREPKPPRRPPEYLGGEALSDLLRDLPKALSIAARRAQQARTSRATIL